MHEWMKKATTHLIVVFLSIAVLLPNGKGLAPQIELYDEVTTASEEIVYTVCNNVGWYFRVEKFTLEKQEADGSWRLIPAEIPVLEAEPVFVLVTNYVFSRAAVYHIRFAETFGGPLEEGHYRFSVMQNYNTDDVLAVTTFDVVQAG